MTTSKLLEKDKSTVASYTLSQLYGQVITSKTKGKKKLLHFALKDSDISQPTWSRVMAGKSLISFDKMKMLCDILNFNFLLTLEEVMLLSKKLSDNGHRASPDRVSIANKEILRYFIRQVETPNRF
ncbi:MAG: hypothetical protein ORN57_05065 [Alphaproteobacteria bacterium]|nr:hypothetical protein [Alphaproteobacteria bacterium]